MARRLGIARLCHGRGAHSFREANICDLANRRMCFVDSTVFLSRFLALQIGGPKLFRRELENNFEKRLEDRIAVVRLSSELRIGLPQKR